ncbi:MAG: hypothetical protein RBT76_00590 [candidate division Zixibacteria bacterium]|jgi:hypothetical protein|nr:hypothetical protein [candidate division Zixibacteria bacterium]
MESIIITLSRTLTAQTVVRRFETMVLEAGLIIHSRGSFADRPGSTHWHVRKPDAVGTLEATWQPATGHFWFSIHENRRGDWISTAVEQLRKKLEDAD